MAAVLGFKSLPEMVFGHNVLEIQHANFELRICAVDALKVRARRLCAYFNCTALHD